jgi:hypothetical protein
LVPALSAAEGATARVPGRTWGGTRASAADAAEVLRVVVVVVEALLADGGRALRGARCVVSLLSHASCEPSCASLPRDTKHACNPLTSPLHLPCSLPAAPPRRARVPAPTRGRLGRQRQCPRAPDAAAARRERRPVRCAPTGSRKRHDAPEDPSLVRQKSEGREEGGRNVSAPPSSLSPVRAESGGSM